jgi:hypothetical protein
VPVKIELFQRTIRPPEAPIDGKKTNPSNLLGQKLLIKEWSNDSHLVSYRQIIAQLLSSILL